MAGAASRFAGANGQSLRFPKEVGTDDVPNYITFRPTVVDFGTYKSGASQRENYGNAFNFGALSQPEFGGTFSIGNLPISVGVKNPFKQLSDQVGGIIDNLSNGVNSILGALSQPGKIQFKLGGNINLFGGKLTARVNLGNLNLDPSIKTSQTKITKLPGINLYLPPELSHSVKANYDTDFKLGALGNEAVNLLDQGFYFNSDTGNYGGAGVESLKRLATAGINDITREGTFGAALQRSTGRVANNYTYAIFNGMKHRSFSYSFKLIARNETDSKVIKDICDSFMFYMLPVRSADDFHHYDIPCMWEISYNRLGTAIKYLDQPNNCFLTDVSVSYGKEGLGQTYNDGAPVDIELKLTFAEIEPLMRTDGDVRKASNMFTSKNVGKGLPADASGPTGVQ